MRIERDLFNNDAEVDLVQWIRGVWAQKLLILSTTLAVSLLALIYVLLTTPVYEATVFVQPPAQNDIASLNYGRGGDSGLSLHSVKDVYGVYLRNLQSEAVHQAFFQDHYLPSLSEAGRTAPRSALYKRFLSSISIAAVNKADPDRYLVRVRHTDPRVAGEWALRYVELAGRHGVGELVKDSAAQAALKARGLAQQINAVRESTRKRRTDRIAQLSEALQVAQSIGLERPLVLSGTQMSRASLGEGDSLTYMHGSKALEAELANLRSRTSDDPFASNLRHMQAALTFYQGLRVEPTSVHVYRQDGVLVLPDGPVKPDKAMILGLAAMFGLMLGLALGGIRTLLGGLSGAERPKALPVRIC